MPWILEYLPEVVAAIGALALILMAVPLIGFWTIPVACAYWVASRRGIRWALD